MFQNTISDAPFRGGVIGLLIGAIFGTMVADKKKENTIYWSFGLGFTGLAGGAQAGQLIAALTNGG